MVKYRKRIMIITVLIIGILIGLSITVKAVNIISSNDVEYNDTNVKKAIDDLYTLASDTAVIKKYTELEDL